MKKVLVNFYDTKDVPGFGVQNLYRMFPFLKNIYDFRLSDNPDYAFYFSMWKDVNPIPCQKPTNKGKVKIFIAGENVYPNLDWYDYSITFYYNDYIKHKRRNRNFRIPLWVYSLYGMGLSPKSLIKSGTYNIDDIIELKSEFCNFIYSNKRATFRNEFFKNLCNYKKVHSWGRALNNMGSRIQYESAKMELDKHVSHNGHNEQNWYNPKIELIKKYKFSIAFENVSTPGYVTEKLTQVMLSTSLPIYWGSNIISRDFNSRSFINFFDYKSTEDVIERIKKIDSNNEILKEYLREPWYNENKIPEFATEEYMISCFKEIFK